MNKITAIILAGGQGKRMETSIAKQYLMLHNKPVLYYSIKAFEESVVDNIVLVVQENMKDWVKTHICEKYEFKKIRKIVIGGKERYDSVYQGLQAVDDADYILIHDGARPFVTEKMIVDSIRDVMMHQACVIGVPSKDTMKIVDSTNTILDTPDRNTMWCIQTPQTFSAELIQSAYQKLYTHKISGITDDAMVVETMMNVPVHVIMGSYQNIKLTTPEDLYVAEAFMKMDMDKNTIQK